MTTIRAGLLAALALLPTAAAAQTEAEPAQPTVQQPAAAPQFTVSQLLSRGFEVKAMSYTNGAVVLVLQGGIDAFVCETDGMGTTRACVSLK